MTPLALRPLDIRLKVAYLADAFNSYAPTEPGNTLSRAYSSLDGTHPYVAMWHSIGNFYTKQEWTELSDAELKEELIVAFRRLAIHIKPLVQSATLKTSSSASRNGVTVDGSVTSSTAMADAQTFTGGLHLAFLSPSS